jgi:hypothetical protein
VSKYLGLNDFNISLLLAYYMKLANSFVGLSFKISFSTKAQTAACGERVVKDHLSNRLRLFAIDFYAKVRRRPRHRDIPGLLSSCVPQQIGLFMKLIIFGILILAAIGCSTTGDKLKTVQKVDIEKFMGDWYVLAGRFTFLEMDVHNGKEKYTWNTY